MLMHKISGLVPDSIHPRTLAYKRILSRAAGKVVAGPFKGMTYITSPDDFVEAAMLMGTYEKELHPTIEAWLANPGDVFIDVGAAQGYYSVGIARRALKARHIAFEMHQERIDQLERTAAANGVKVEPWGACDRKRLVEALNSGTSPHVIMDVEGYEDELLRDEVLPALVNTHLIIETHDCYVPGITQELIRRLEPTHTLESVELGERTAADLPFRFSDRWSVKHLNEGRVDDQQTWLIATPKRG
jgi:hypothetical protein